MTDNEIIKALECCTDRKSGFTCNGCPLKNVPFCGGEIMRGSLDLINRQQAEIERLKPIEENFDKLLYMLNAVDSGQSVLEEQKHTIKSEARKEFADILIDKAGNAATWTGIEPVVTIADIKSLLIEMESETNV